MPDEQTDYLISWVSLLLATVAFLISIGALAIAWNVPEQYTVPNVVSESNPNITITSKEDEHSRVKDKVTLSELAEMENMSTTGILRRIKNGFYIDTYGTKHTAVKVNGRWVVHLSENQ